MLARAAERLPPGTQVKFVRADATTYRFESAALDLLFSRFGMMFFAEPARAFANLRTALKPSGRLAFACWRKFNENPWLQVPLRAASVCRLAAGWLGSGPTSNRLSNRVADTRLGAADDRACNAAEHAIPLFRFKHDLWVGLWATPPCPDFVSNLNSRRRRTWSHPRPRWPKPHHRPLSASPQKRTK